MDAATTRNDAIKGVAPSDSPRERMLVAAAELISERGLSNTRIADVANRVGTSPALVVYYFATKDNLLGEALRHAERDFYRTLDELLQKTGELPQLLEAVVDLAFPNEARGETGGTWGLRLELWSAAFRDTRVATDRQAIDDQWRGLIKRIVSNGREAVQFAPEEFAERLDRFAVGWAALLDGLSVQLALKDSALEWGAAREIALDYAHRELGLA